MTRSPGRLLVVDDEVAVLEVLGEYFAGQGYQVATARGGAEALARVEAAPPDLVLLDVRMPGGLDGVEVLRRLRRLAPDLPVIMVTGSEDLALARETLALGAFDYVSKPFDVRYLDRAVAAALAATGRGRPGGDGDRPGDDPWRRLVFAVFRAGRTMSAAGRLSTGERMEKAVLAAWREAAAGRAAAARQHLAEIELLASVAADLGDLPLAVRATVETALGAVDGAVAET